jgi:hypothetical protein
MGLEQTLEAENRKPAVSGLATGGFSIATRIDDIGAT